MKKEKQPVQATSASVSSMGALSLIPACKPYYATAYAHIKQDQRAEFMRILTRDAPEMAKISMVSGGSWESITGDTPFIIHLWQSLLSKIEYDVGSSDGVGCG